MLAIDTETTGLDVHHGAKPFLTTVCDEDGNVTYWEWDVDPLTREPIVPRNDLTEIQDIIVNNSQDDLVLQNAKFDATALKALFARSKRSLTWPWESVHDTLLSGHLLASNHPHDLTSMALEYLGVNIKPLEDELKQAVTEARRIVRAKYPEWRIAQEGLPEMPSCTTGGSCFDYWLPRAVALEQNLPNDHPWYRVCADYANGDSTVTVALFKVHRDILISRGLWEIYLERQKCLRVAWLMEQRGITLHHDRLLKQEQNYIEQSEKMGSTCLKIAEEHGYSLVLPKTGNNNSLRKFVFDVLKCPQMKHSKKTGVPSLDSKVIEQYESVLEGKSLEFVRALAGKRKRDTAISYMDGYRRFGLHGNLPGYYVLHPTMKVTGSDTLRWASANPNGQNISKKEDFNLRYCFGPAPGREWWSLDAQNIELRIPAYEAGETAMIEIFEKPDDPPYYGSYHLLVFDTLHPEKFAKDGKNCKDIYKSTWYQWTKNGNFAVGYGSVEESGTADRAYHVPGAFRRIKGRFAKIHGPNGLNARMIDHASQFGYVETIPDKSINPNRGYPLLCSRSMYGDVKPTVPLNYHVQGTAMWWMMRAMIKCQEYLDIINRRYTEGYYMILQVHDELLFDFPKRTVGKQNRNLPIIAKIKRLMESCGDDIGIPTPVSVTYHADNWSKGTEIAL